MLSGSPRECAHRSASVHAARLLCMHFQSLKNLYLHFPLISFIVPIIILFAWVKSIIQNFDTFTCIWISLLCFRSLNSRKSWDRQANWTRLSVNKGTARSLSDYNYQNSFSFLFLLLLLNLVIKREVWTKIDQSDKTGTHQKTKI